MSITKTFRKLSPEDRKEAKSLMKDLMSQDGMGQKDAAREAISIMTADANKDRDKLIKEMT
jgi:hypothetical protein